MRIRSLMFLGLPLSLLIAACAAGTDEGGEKAKTAGAAAGGGTSDGGAGSDSLSAVGNEPQGTGGLSSGSGNVGGAGGQGEGLAGGSGGGGVAPSEAGTCATAVDLSTTTGPYSITGSFTDVPAMGGGSCASDATNVAWFRYKPAETGTFIFSAENSSTTQAYGRLAIFEDNGCSALGSEVMCEAATEADVDSGKVELTGGTDYLIMFYTDGETFAMVDPKIEVTPIVVPPGGTCSKAPDLSAVTFPHTMDGLFEDTPDPMGSCNGAIASTVWFKYTAPTTELYRVTLKNSTSTYATSRMLVFEGDSCAPLGTEVACGKQLAKEVSRDIEFTQGTTYTVALHVSASNQILLDPVVNVVVAPPPPPGGSCGLASDISSATFPHTVSGTFDGDPASAGSCDSSPNNAVWYRYTPSVTGWYHVSARNLTTTSAYSRLAIFEGAGCGPLGTELDCKGASGKAVTSEAVQLTAGVPYTISFFTDGDSYTMVDPQISVVAAPAPVPGSSCAAAADITTASFPTQLTGTFEDDVASGMGSCDSSGDNIVWFKYTAPTTGSYDISTNNATTALAFSRLAIFASTTCGSLTGEVACIVNNATNASASGVNLVGGTDYLIAFYTENNSYAMVDPSITISAQ